MEKQGNAIGRMVSSLSVCHKFCDILYKDIIGHTVNVSTGNEQYDVDFRDGVMHGLPEKLRDSIRNGESLHVTVGQEFNSVPYEHEHRFIRVCHLIRDFAENHMEKAEDCTYRYKGVTLYIQDMHADRKGFHAFDRSFMKYRITADYMPADGEDPLYDLVYIYETMMLSIESAERHENAGYILHRNEQ